MDALFTQFRNVSAPQRSVKDVIEDIDKLLAEAMTLAAERATYERELLFAYLAIRHRGL